MKSFARNLPALLVLAAAVGLFMGACAVLENIEGLLDD